MISVISWLTRNRSQTCHQPHARLLQATLVHGEAQGRLLTLQLPTSVSKPCSGECIEVHAHKQKMVAVSVCRDEVQIATWILITITLNKYPFLCPRQYNIYIS